MLNLCHGSFANWTVNFLVIVSTHWSFDSVDVLVTEIDFFAAALQTKLLNEQRLNFPMNNMPSYQI